jgi:hypothetical protein
MITYELQIEDDQDEVFAISLVESPAIESNFIYFAGETVLFAKVDNEQRMLIGPILIPDKKILRVDGEGNPYEVFFKKDTVRKLAQNYLKKRYTSNATLEHDSKIKGVHLVESWVKEGKMDKSHSYGLALPEGTWMGVFKIDDEKIWNDYVKTGKVKGFSIEGFFEHKIYSASHLTRTQEMGLGPLTDEQSNILLDKIKAIIIEEINKSKFAEPSITSTYPGEVTSGSISPAILE